MIQVQAITSKGVTDISIPFDLNNILYVNVKSFESNILKADAIEVKDDSLDMMSIALYKKKAIFDLFKDNLEDIQFDNIYGFNELLESLISIVTDSIANYATDTTNTEKYSVTIKGIEYSVNLADANKALGIIPWKASEFVEAQFLAFQNKSNKEDSIDIRIKKDITYMFGLFALLVRKKDEVIPIDEPEKFRQFIAERSLFWANNLKYTDALNLHGFFLNIWKQSSEDIHLYTTDYQRYIKAKLVQMERNITKV